MKWLPGFLEEWHHIEGSANSQKFVLVPGSSYISLVRGSPCCGAQRSSSSLSPGLHSLGQNVKGRGWLTYSGSCPFGCSMRPLWECYLLGIEKDPYTLSPSSSLVPSSPLTRTIFKPFTTAQEYVTIITPSNYHIRSVIIEVSEALSTGRLSLHS